MLYHNRPPTEYVNIYGISQERSTIVSFIYHELNALMPSEAHMFRQPRPSLVQIMVWRLFGVKPLSEPMLEYC